MMLHHNTEGSTFAIDIAMAPCQPPVKVKWENQVMTTQHRARINTLLMDESISPSDKELEVGAQNYSMTDFHGQRHAFCDLQYIQLDVSAKIRKP
ncbi:hypothetical protein INR49_012318 [Caranx melampygus]|nr:hypothetical protein INR49_012318 [Caranx melampygus]